MGKKNKNKKRKEKVQETQPVETTQVETSQVVESKKIVKAVKLKEKRKNPKKTKKGSKLVKRLKETGSELKKVSWPSFPTVLKKTGVVLVVVLFFGLVLFGIDFGLSKLFEVLVP